MGLSELDGAPGGRVQNSGRMLALGVKCLRQIRKRGTHLVCRVG
jgi:hypothetical protein